MARENNSEYLKTTPSVPGSDLTWEAEDAYWQDSFRTRPYVLGDDYEQYRPAYRYGFDSARHNMGGIATSIAAPGNRPGRTSRTRCVTRGTGSPGTARRRRAAGADQAGGSSRRARRRRPTVRVRR
jgi:hypothetical protein